MWHNIKLKNNAIQKQTGKATLIKIPSTDLLFWLPQKLVRVANAKEISIGINVEFKYILLDNLTGDSDEVDGFELLTYFEKDNFNKSFG